MKLAEREIVRPASAPAAVVIIAPAWRFGRRGPVRRAVEAAVARWKERGASVVVACQAAAAPALREGADVVIIPASETGLSAVACALDTCSSDPVFITDVDAEASAETLSALRAVLGEDAAVAAVVDRERGLRPFPLLCRRAARPLIGALLEEADGSIESLLRRPWARLATL
jgi:molybdopterin-guanine dinucleotide biosynthesis protein A